MINSEKNIIKELSQFIENKNTLQTRTLLFELHPADIADLLLNFSVDDRIFILNCIDNEDSANVLLELDEDDRKDSLHLYSAKEIAEDIIDEMDSDDAADVISELSATKKSDVISQIEDEEHAKSIVDLLKYDEDTAGGIMAKEMIKLNKDLNVLSAVKEMRKQAEELEEVYSIYIIDEKEKLLGILNLKKLLTTSSVTKLENVYSPKVYSVNVNDSTEEVARIMQKYDLFEIPVIDELNTLVGKITIDDVMDIITTEAEKDYQLASGISNDVDYQDSLIDLTKARLPWLVIGMIGGLIGSKILQSNQSALQSVPMLMFFIPLIAATAGNVGVQSSAIVVQGIANGSLKGSLFNNLKKEITVSLISGFALSGIILIFNLIMNSESPFLVPLTISTALLTVIINASIIGTIIPIMLNKKGIDPAIATGPFITTSNDILGVLIYFFIAKLFLGI